MTGDADDELVLLANHAMRARHRPRAILVLWAWQAAWGFVLGWPAASIVAASYGSHPAGDAPLFRPGGLELLDLLAGAQRSEAALMSGHVLVLAPVAILSTLLPLAGVLAAIAHATRERRRPPARATLGRALSAFGAMFWLLVAGTVAAGAVTALALLLGTWSAEGLAGRAGEALADQVGVLVTGVTLVPAAIVGVLHDLARAAAVRFRVGALRAVALAWDTWRRDAVATVWSWAWRALVAWSPVFVAALAATRLGGRGGLALFVLFALHQCALLARVSVRASWLARAMRAVDHAHQVVAVAPERPNEI